MLENVLKWSIDSDILTHFLAFNLSRFSYYIKTYVMLYIENCYTYIIIYINMFWIYKIQLKRHMENKSIEEIMINSNSKVNFIDLKIIL